MELNESIYVYLSSYTALTNLISTRIYTDESRQANPHTMPYLTYGKVSEIEVDTLTEQSTMLISSAYQFDVYARDRHTARNVAKQVRKAFKGLKGQIGGETGVTLSAVQKINALSDTDRDNTTGEIAFREMLEFQLWHYETA